LALFAIAALSCLSLGHAAEAGRRSFDVPAGLADQTLKAFSDQADVAVLFATDSAGRIRTNAVKGNYTTAEAMAMLLRDSGLVAVASEKTGTFTITRDPNAPRAAPSPAKSDRPLEEKGTEAVSRAAAGLRAPDGGEAVMLSPFEVSTERDTGYAASQSLSGSRLATELRFIPAPVSVITREQLDDLAATDLHEAMRWSVNTVSANSSDAGGALNQGTSTRSLNENTISTRGMQASLARNFFKWSVNADTFNIERLDLSRGPNGLLFGDSNLAGMVNISTKRAKFRPANSVLLQADSYGGFRAELDVNHPLIERKLAVRMNAVVQQTDSWLDFGRVDQKGASLTGTWKPVPGLEVRLEGEMGWRNNIFSPPYLRSTTAAWNHVAVFDTPGSLNAAQAAAAGLGRIGANVFVVNVARSADGPINWATMGQTVGGAVQSWVAVKLPPNSTLLPVSVLEPGRLSATPVYTDFVVPSFAFSMRNGATRLASEHHTASLFVEKRVGRSLMVEAAANLQVEDRLNYTRQNGNVDLAFDVNRRLPAGYAINGSNDNPYFLQPYIQSNQRIYNNYTRVWEARASAVYRWEQPWFKQSFGVLTAFRRFDAGQRRSTLTRTNGPVANLADASNAIYLRSYVAERQFSSIDYLRDHVHTLGDARIEYVNHNGVAGGQTHADSQIRSYQVFASGSWLKSERIHTVLGIRRDDFYSKQLGAHVFDPVTGRYVRSNLSEILRSTIDSPTAGAVVGVLPWLSAYVNTSRSYNPPTTAVLDYQNRAIEAPMGMTREVGLKFALFDNRVSGSLGFYQSEQKNNRAFSNTLNNALEIIHGQLGLPYAGTPSDSNTLSAEGWEFELHSNLTRAWSLTANLGVPESSPRGSFPSFRSLYAERRANWQAIADNAADPRSTVMRAQLNLIDTELATAAAGEGLAGIGSRKFTANLLTRYQFHGGLLRGLSVGGGVNYLGDQKIGRTTGDVFTEGYSLLSAFARYTGTWRRRSWSLQANATNLLDTEKFRYLELVLNRPGPFRVVPPRQVRVTLNLSF
jgi:outer membrane receptor for ferric coprogen and ferric-rhodotorulic acid